MNKQNLVEGEIYKTQSEYSDCYHVYKFKSVKGNMIQASNYIFISNTIDSHYTKNSERFSTSNKNLETTSEEKHWLNECIRLDKFITKKEAMKTFVPEYIKAISSAPGQFTINKIYKVKQKHHNCFYVIEDDRGSLTNGWGIDNFISSTKEEYDAQFIIKEPEFVLPEKWWIKVIDTVEDRIVCNWINKKFNKNYNSGYIGGNGYCYSNTVLVNNDYYCINIPRYIIIFKNYTEITFKQFKQYVLKEPIEQVEELQQPSENASIEEILEYCKKKYPTGTKCKNYYSKTETFYVEEIVKSSFSHKGIYTQNGRYCIYYEGRYVEIIETVETKQKSKINETINKTYTLDQIKKVLLKEYVKEDANDILKVIESIK